MSIFLIEDRLTVPTALALAHEASPQQSINVLNVNCTNENKLIRLFLGTVYISHVDSGKKWKQTINYSVLGCPTVTFKTYKGIEPILAAYDISPEELDVHLRKTLRQQEYYGDLLGEICHSLWRTSRGEHTLSFLHLYRFLEHISFAFPMLYAARTSNFSGAYSSLKEYFSGGDKGELGFLRKFIDVSLDPVLLSEAATIQFSNVLPAYLQDVYSAIKAQIIAPDENILSDVQGIELKVKNRAILNLCVNLRNRYFHFLSTNPTNISINKIGDSDALFQCVNQAILNFLAILYFETLKHRVLGS